MAAADDGQVDDVPPGAKLGFEVRRYNGERRRKGSVEESRRSARTVRDARERLEEIGVGGEDVYFGDARQNRYGLTPQAEVALEESEAYAD